MSPARILATLLCLLPAVALGGSVYTPAPTPAGIGAQPVDATLTALAGGACEADRVLYCSGVDTITSAVVTTAGRALWDDATAADQLVTLGAGALCTGADATDVPYTPATGVDWTDPDPVEAADALDTLAGRVVALESAPAVSDAADVTYTPASLLDWAGSADPGDVADALDQIADRTTAIEGAGAGLQQIDWSGASAIVTGSAATGGGSATGDKVGFVNLGLIHRIRIVATSNTVNVTFRLYAEAARTTLLYEASGVDAYSAAYEDAVPVHYRDADATGKLHYSVINNGANASTFTVTIAAIGE